MSANWRASAKARHIRLEHVRRQPFSLKLAQAAQHGGVRSSRCLYARQ
jgi:hypothetical protein